MPEETGKGAGLEVLPEAIARRHCVVSLSERGETVIVERWSLSKMLYVFEYVASFLKGVPNEELLKFKGQPFEIALRFIRLIGDKATGFLQLVVREEDRDRVTEDLPAEDALEILQAVVDLNFSEGFLKKATVLGERFRQVFGSKK